MSGAIGGRGAAGPQGPAGPPGQQGPAGPPGLIDISAGQVTTGEPGTEAQASVEETEPGVFVLSLTIPQGADGDSNVELAVGTVTALPYGDAPSISFVGEPPVGFNITAGTVTDLPAGSSPTVTITVVA